MSPTSRNPDKEIHHFLRRKYLVNVVIEQNLWGLVNIFFSDIHIYRGIKNGSHEIKGWISKEKLITENCEKQKGDKKIPPTHHHHLDVKADWDLEAKKNKNDRIGKESKRMNLGTSKNLQSEKIFFASC